jgi:DNA-binding NtrC family response regulator
LGEVQLALLRVLQEREFERVGSNQPISVDVRVLAATNRDLEAMMNSGAFREDLYYRLKVIELTVPALRERPDEIRPLTDFFLAKYSRKYNRPGRSISDELRQRFSTYEWPGNIRELENLVKRMVILQDEQLVLREMERQAERVHAAAGAAAVSVPVGTAVAMVGVGASSLPAESARVNHGAVGVPSSVATSSGSAVALEEPLPEGPISLSEVARAAAMRAERVAIERTLRQVHWNRRKAAQILGVSYKTLLNKIKDCGIHR